MTMTGPRPFEPAFPGSRDVELPYQGDKDPLPATFTPCGVVSGLRERNEQGGLTKYR